MKIMTVIGARPQFIKAAMVSMAIARNARLSECIVHTGQHFDANMSAVFFDEMGIPEPAHHLGIGGGTHGQNTGRMIEAIEKIAQLEKPTVILVYGDTDSTLAAALAAAKLHIPVVHIEAGLRSFNRRMPEEINRVVTDHVSDLLLTPNDVAVANLQAEGIAGSHVRNVGDVMYDAALHFGKRAVYESRVLEREGLSVRRYILATVHRQDNTDDQKRLSRILDCFASARLPVVLPLHPRTRSRIESFGLRMPQNVRVIEPVGFLDMVMLEKSADLIVTDSGGVQKEAYFHGVPCVTLRNETEWVELVDMGWNRLASPDSPDLGDLLLHSYPPGTRMQSPYGNGDAAEKAVRYMLEAFGKPTVSES